MDYATFRIITAVLSSGVCFFSAVFVLSRHPNLYLNKVYAVSNILLGFWNISDIIIVSISDPSIALFFDRMSYVWGIFVVPTFFLLCLAVADVRIKHKFVSGLLWGIAVVFSVLAFSPWVITHVETLPFFIEHPGPLYPFFIVYFVFCLGYGVYELKRAHRKADGLRKNQLKYLSLALVIAFVAGLLYFGNIINPKIPPLFYILEIIYIGVVAYAVIRYRAMDINLAFRYGTVYSLYAAGTAVPLAFFYFFFGENFLIGTSLILLGVLAGSIFPTVVRETITGWVDGLPFFKGRYLPSSVVDGILDELGRAETMEQLPWVALHVAMRISGARSASVLTIDPGKKTFYVRASKGLPVEKTIFLSHPDSGAVAVFLKEKQRPAMKDLVSTDFPENMQKKAMEEFGFLEGEIVFPVFYQGDLHALIVIGAHQKNRTYNDLDLAYLTRLANRTEHVLETLMSGLSHQQLTAVWAHDLIKPFSSKGSFRWVRDMGDGVFGDLPVSVKEKLKLIQFDLDWVSGNLEKIIHPTEFDHVSMQPNSLDVLYSRVFFRYDLLAKELGIKFTVDIPPGDLRIVCNVPMLEHRVISNLVENAFRYTSSGGAVRVGYSVKGDRFLGCVEDTGIGIKKEDLDRVWDAGVQLSQELKGMAGLGLYSVKTVVTLHQGRVWVESEKGKGSRFVFDLPIVS